MAKMPRSATPRPMAARTPKPAETRPAAPAAGDLMERQRRRAAEDIIRTTTRMRETPMKRK